MEYYLGLYDEKIKKLQRVRDIACYTRGKRLMSIMMRNHKALLLSGIATQQQLLGIKQGVLEILQTLPTEGVTCFLPQGDGYIPTTHEGYVVRNFDT